MYFLVILTFVSRFVFRPWDYMHNIDSYAYMAIGKTRIIFDPTVLSWLTYYLGVYWTLIVLYFCNFILAIMFFYLCREFEISSMNSFLASLIFMMSPLVFFNSQPEIYDKNIFVILIFTINLLLFMKFLKFRDIYNLYNHETQYWSLMGWFFLWAFSVLISFFFWQGALLIVAMNVVMLSLLVIQERQWLVLGLLFGLPGIGLAVALWSRFKDLTFGYSGSLIMETRSIMELPGWWEYIIFALCLFYIMFLMARENFKHKVLAVMFYATLGLGIVMFRMLIFFLPLAYLVYGMILQLENERKDHKIYFGLFILIPFMLFGVNSHIYTRQPFMNDNIMDALVYAEGLNSSCIASEWSYGHIYRYYSNKTILYSAHPKDVEAIHDWLVWGNRTGCILLWTQGDIKALNFSMDFYDHFVPENNFFITNITNESMIFNQDNRSGTVWVYG